MRASLSRSECTMPSAAAASQRQTRPGDRSVSSAAGQHQQEDQHRRAQSFTEPLQQLDHGVEDQHADADADTRKGVLHPSQMGEAGDERLPVR